MKQLPLNEDQNKPLLSKKLKSAMEIFHGRFFIIGILLLAVSASCDQRKELLDKEVFDGPIMEMKKVNTMLSDSGRQALQLRSPLQLDFDNGDRSYPEGLFLMYYGKSEDPICTFESNTAFFNQEENLWKGEGNVHVKNLQNNDELTTEELYWSPADEQFFTDKFVTIESQGEIHKGQGLRANQDFTSYQILKPSGTINLREEF